MNDYDAHQEYRKSLSKLQLARFEAADAREAYAEAKMRGFSGEAEQMALDNRNNQLSELLTKLHDEFNGLMARIEMMTSAHNANAVMDEFMDKQLDDDELVEAARTYIQTICPHEHTELGTIGGMRLVMGEVYDDYEEIYVYCTDCGKDVEPSGKDIQDDTWSQF